MMFITVFQLTCRSIGSRVSKLFLKDFRNGLFHKELFSDIFYFKFYGLKEYYIYILMYITKERKQIFTNFFQIDEIQNI